MICLTSRSSSAISPAYRPGRRPQQAEAEAERIGVGVTSEAQSIFDALTKTLPVHWDKTVIMAMNAVRVSSLYLTENVSGETLAANQRVKKVAEGQLSSLFMHQSTFPVSCHGRLTVEMFTDGLQTPCRGGTPSSILLTLSQCPSYFHIMIAPFFPFFW